MAYTIAYVCTYVYIYIYTVVIYIYMYIYICIYIYGFVQTWRVFAQESSVFGYSTKHFRWVYPISLCISQDVFQASTYGFELGRASKFSEDLFRNWEGGKVPVKH